MNRICFRKQCAIGMLLVLNLCIPAAIAETLEEAWAVAIVADRSLEAVRRQTQAAEQTLSAAKAIRWPNIDVKGAYTQLDDVPELDLGQTGLPLTLSQFGIAGDDNFFAARGQINIPLYTSGRISRGIDAASAGLNAARFQEQGSTQNTKLAVAEAFVGVLRAQRAAEVAKTNIESLTAHARDVENLYKKGLVPKNDLLAARVALADARQKGITANNRIDIGRAAYNRRLGRALHEPVILEEVMPRLAPEALKNDLQILTKRALNQRTELIWLFEQAQALRHRASGIRAEGNPQIGLTGAYTYLENSILDDEDVWSASVGIQWTLFDGGVIKSRAGAFNKQSEALLQQREDLVSIIALQVRQVWLDVNETQKRLDVTREAVDQAEENLKVAKDRYRSGLANNTVVLDAEGLRTLSRSNHYNARYDAALAKVRLARAVGLL